MPKDARVTDLWFGACEICSCPYGPIITGSPDVYVNNLQSARKWDLTMCMCNNHIGVIITGSPNVFVNNRPDARVTDVVGCGNNGIIVTGSPNLYVNGIG